MSLIPFVILDVDARDKRGHDESNIARIGIIRSESHQYFDISSRAQSGSRISPGGSFPLQTQSLERLDWHGTRELVRTVVRRIRHIV